MKLFDTSHLIRWLRTHNILPRYKSSRRPFRGIKTEFSATVFTGTVQQWADYLRMPRDERYDKATCVSILWSKGNRTLAFRAENNASQKLADCLNDAFNTLAKRIAAIPHVQSVYHQVLFENDSNGWTDLFLRESSILPSEASREIVLDDSLSAVSTDIVLQSCMLEKVLRAYEQVRRNESADVRLAYAWPMVRRVFAQLGYHSNPRDRFVEKIDLVYRNSLLAVNLLFEGKSMGQLVPNQLGKIYQRYVSQKSGVDEDELFEEHSYFRLLNELSFLRDEKNYRDYDDIAKVLVREYLDGRYLRLSLGGVMPDVTEAMAPMPFVRKKKGIRTPLPKIGCYGILDDDDLQAWKKIEDSFREMGFALLRQLGMGEFGRVYEALNHGNPSIPRRVAIKVDRIRSGMKKQAILNAGTTLQISRDLARSPHVIRIYDAGKLHKQKYTYHVLQLINGDTLDNLIGVTGREHSSIHRPESPRSSKEAHDEYVQAVRGSQGEGWRRKGLALPFTQPLSLSQLLDLLTSILLWVEEVHQLNYAVNDLKNGNLMLSRRGQLKGIDMDSYGPIQTEHDKLTDFCFLAISLLLLIVNVSGKAESESMSDDWVRTRDAIRSRIAACWTFGDVAGISHGRVRTEQVVEMLTDLVQRCRNHEYRNSSDRFTEDINHLIQTKRRIFLEEIVLD